MPKELRYNKYKIAFKNEKQTPIELWATSIFYNPNHISFTNTASRKINYINLSEVLYVEVLMEGMSEEAVRDIINSEIMAEAYRY